MAQQASQTNTSRIHFGKTLLALCSLGLPGILSLIPVIIGQIEQLPPGLTELPPILLVALSLLNPLILLVIAVVVGTLLAPRIGLRSLVAEKVSHATPIWPQLRPSIPLACGLGIFFSVVVLGLDQAINPFADTELVNETATLSGLLSQLLLGLLYGGIVEELLLRWGIMSLLVWIGWRVLQRGSGQPHPALIWGAITLAAVLFGLGHLPAMAGMVELTPLIILRTVLLNALGGMLFGWLYWKHSLEAAMIAHAATHVGFFLLNAAFLMLNIG
ncbi:MAG TPA: CPBP family intramembrane metalloprotease [Roseiflexaceae bacterium]|nr:CPBP family intramembrane metalloprotease [Roseiflexaceae bacterium]HMP41365.1 CPBP family intramembrane metalloprotease [Roseiflexaceae bacterium]